MSDVFSYIHEIEAPDGVVFIVWTRFSGIHNDLSVECKDQAQENTTYGLKYHGHLEHPEDEPSADARMCDIEVLILAGEDL